MTTELETALASASAFKDAKADNAHLAGWLFRAETSLAAEKQARETAERELSTWRQISGKQDGENRKLEDIVTRLTAERETLRREISRIVGEIERQNVVNDRYAEQSSKPLSDPRETWLICNSHIKDHARELRAALEASATDEVKP